MLHIYVIMFNLVFLTSCHVAALVVCIIIACMHMLNDLWSKVYPEPVVDNTEEEEEEEGEDTITE